MAPSLPPASASQLVPHLTNVQGLCWSHLHLGFGCGHLLGSELWNLLAGIIQGQPSMRSRTWGCPWGGMTLTTAPPAHQLPPPGWSLWVSECVQLGGHWVLRRAHPALHPSRKGLGWLGAQLMSSDLCWPGQDRTTPRDPKCWSTTKLTLASSALK